MEDLLLDQEEEVKKLTFKTRTFKSTHNEEKDENEKYAISVWKLNKGKEPQQVSEYSFDEDPVNQRFYISQSGSQVIVLFEG